MVKKIAFSGMRGRKKDTFVMCLAVALSVLFIVTSINLFTSAQAARQIEKFERFGYWHSAFYNLESKMADEVQRQNKNSAAMTLLGHDVRIGQMASIPENHQEIGDFKMFEGKMPTAANEIAFEYSQLQNFTETLAVGDTIKVEQIFYVKEYPVASDLDPRVQAYFRDLKGTKEALSAQNERLAQGAYKDYLASLKDENHKDHAFNKSLSESNEPMAFEAFSEHFVTHSGDLWTYLYQEEDPYYEGEALPPLYYPVASNAYNTIDTEFIDVYRLDRVQKIVFFRRVEEDSTLFLPKFIEDTSYDSSKTLVELIQAYGKPYSDYVIVTREYQISGFFEDYSGIWESGQYILPTAFVTEEEKEALLEVLQATSLVGDEIELIKPESLVSKRIVFFPEPARIKGLALDRLVTNTLSYPENAPKADLTLTYGLLAMIFMGTAISIFQINYAQMKRRTKKLVLLKSIGMVNGQLMGLLLWEVLLVLILAIPIGAMLGMSLSYGLVFLIQDHSTFKVVFAVKGAWLLMGIGASVISVFIGMLIPLKVAKGVPLVGAMNLPPRRERQKSTQPHGPQTRKRLTFGRFMIQTYLRERKKTLITIGLYGIASIMVSSAVVLSFFAFKSYFYEAVVPGRPDFYLTFNTGLNEYAIDDALEAILETGRFETPEMVLVGEQLRLYHPELMAVGRYQERNESDSVLDGMAFLDSLFGAIEGEKSYSQNAIKTKIYSYPENSQTLRALYDLAEVDSALYPFEAFEKSHNQVILVVPYHDGGKILSYDHRHRFELEAPYPFEVGDSLLVASLLESIAGSVEEKKEFMETLEVIGIVQGFKDIGIWPLTHALDEPVIVTGRTPYRTLYPTTKYRRIPPKKYLTTQVENRNWMKFGKSFMSLTIKPGVDPLVADFDLEQAVYVPFTLDAYYPSAFEYVSIEPTYLVNQSAFEKSLRMAVIFTTLGLSMAVIMLMAQYNIGLSKLENERDKIGVLQAIGVTRSSFKKAYGLSGVGFSFLVIGLTNALFFSGVGLAAAVHPGNFIAGWGEILWHFPWKIYGISQCVFLIFGTLVCYLPCLKIIKHQPIVNINAR